MAPVYSIAIGLAAGIVMGGQPLLAQAPPGATGKPASFCSRSAPMAGPRTRHSIASPVSRCHPRTCSTSSTVVSVLCERMVPTVRMRSASAGPAVGRASSCGRHAS